MKLWDFECMDCGATVERMTEDNELSILCMADKCSGVMVRRMGGRPTGLKTGKSNGGPPCPDCGGETTAVTTTMSVMIPCGKKGQRQ